MTEKENLIDAMKSGDIESSLELTEKILSEGIPAAEIADSSQIHVSDNEYGIRTTDSRLVASTTELLTNNEMMNKALHYQQFGCYSGNLAGAIYGGYAGGAEGTAVLQTAYHLMGTLLYSPGKIRKRYSGSSHRENHPRDV